MAVATVSTSPEAAAAKRGAAFLAVDNVVKRFETPDGPITAVDHVSFTV